MAIGIKLKHNTGEITTGTGDLQLGAAGNLKLKYATFPSADGSNTHVLSTDGSGNLSWVAQSGGATSLNGLTDVTITSAANNDVLQYNGTAWVDVALTTASVAEAGNLYYTDARVDSRFDTRLATKDTDNLSEGSTNLYYTNARAKAATVADTIVNGTVDVAPSQNAVFDALALKEPTVTAGTSLQYYRGDKTFQTLNTAVVAESGNLYYTDARANSAFDTRLATKTTANLAENTNLYYTDARFDTRLAA